MLTEAREKSSHDTTAESAINLIEGTFPSGARFISRFNIGIGPNFVVTSDLLPRARDIRTSSSFFDTCLFSRQTGTESSPFSFADELADLRFENSRLRESVDELRREVALIRSAALDLSPVILWEVDLPEAILRFREPISVNVILSEDRSHFIGQYDVFGIYTYAFSRGELVSKLHEEIAYLWEKFAFADDVKLAPSAQKLKSRLRESIVEMPDD